MGWEKVKKREVKPWEVCWGDTYVNEHLEDV